MPNNPAALLEKFIEGFGGVSKNMRDTQKRLEDLTKQIAKAKTPDDLLKLENEMQKASQMLQVLSGILETQRDLAKTVVQNTRS